MKTILKLLTIGLLSTIACIGKPQQLQAAPPSSTTYTTIIPGDIDKINISGNIELILMQDASNHIRIYNDQFRKHAFIQEKDGELRVSAFSPEKLTIIVHLKNLSALAASDHSSIKTFGSFKLLNLNIKLSGQARAEINADLVGLHTHVADNAFLLLSGVAIDHATRIEGQGKIDLARFSAGDSAIYSHQIRGCRISNNRAPMEQKELNTAAL